MLEFGALVRNIVALSSRCSPVRWRIIGACALSKLPTPAVCRRKTMGPAGAGPIAFMGSAVSAGAGFRPQTLGRRDRPAGRGVAKDLRMEAAG